MLVILSSGRSGTNILLECFTKNSYYIPTTYPEDKELTKRNIEYPQKYLCKADTHYISNYQEFFDFMVKNQHCEILWSVRHPYDWCLSKLYRGRPTKSRGYKIADDATVDGCVEDLTKMYNIYKQAIIDFPLRILVVKMEDLLTDIEKEVKKICNWLGIIYEKEMSTPHLRMRHKGKKERYKTIDKSQIGLYKDIDTIYDGYFSKRKKTVDKLFNSEIVQTLIKEFKYEINS